MFVTKVLFDLVIHKSSMRKLFYWFNGLTFKQHNALNLISLQIRKFRYRKKVPYKQYSNDLHSKIFIHAHLYTYGNRIDYSYSFSLVPSTVHNTHSKREAKLFNWHELCVILNNNKHHNMWINGFFCLLGGVICRATKTTTLSALFKQ